MLLPRPPVALALFWVVVLVCRGSPIAAAASCGAVPHSVDADGGHCLCAPYAMCVGPLCAPAEYHGPNASSLLSQHSAWGAHLGSGFHPGMCPSCRCAPTTSLQRHRLPVYAWGKHRQYYHLHISKTGGTSFMNLLFNLARRTGLDVCPTERLPFSHGDGRFFADPAALQTCHVASAEGQVVVLRAQFLRGRPHLLVLLRHPVLRTWSQWHHDNTYLNVKTQQTVMNATCLVRRPNSTDCVTRAADIYTSLDRVYNDTAGSMFIRRRYSDWQSYRLRETYKGVHAARTAALPKYSFLGLTEHFATAMCLFYFTFQLYADFATCQAAPPVVYNVACGSNTTDISSVCAEGLFVNNALLREGAELTSRKLADIGPKLVRMIETHNPLDMELYAAAVRVFWARVHVMEQITGRIFGDMPPAVRAALTHNTTSATTTASTV